MLEQVGGTQLMMGDDIGWNFGLHPITDDVATAIGSKPSLYDRFPNVKGRWDGKATINHWLAIRQVLGDKAEDLIQKQPRGTCGGRAGSFASDALQCILMATGKKAKFHRVSHAAVYYMARKLFGMIGGSWQDQRNDGVASGSVPKALAELGLVQREEDSDLNWYGAGSDDLACQLGAGLKSDVAQKILQFGGTTCVTEWSPISSAQELADGIAAGGMGIGSDAQGFTMTRDRNGFCSPRGTWQHYQTRVSVGVWGGRPGFGYNQSWGKEGLPGGPLLPDHPGNCFGVDFSVQDRIIKSGNWAVLFAFPLWDLEKGPVDLPWTF